MKPMSIDAEAVTLASISIVSRLIDTLVSIGVLSHADTDAIFAEAIGEQQRSTAAPNQRAAYVLHLLRTENEKARPLHL